MRHVLLEKASRCQDQTFATRQEIEEEKSAFKERVACVCDAPRSPDVFLHWQEADWQERIDRERAISYVIVFLFLFGWVLMEGDNGSRETGLQGW